MQLQVMPSKSKFRVWQQNSKGNWKNIKPLPHIPRAPPPKKKKGKNESKKVCLQATLFDKFPASQK